MLRLTQTAVEQQQSNMFKPQDRFQGGTITISAPARSGSRVFCRFTVYMRVPFINKSTNKSTNLASVKSTSSAHAKATTLLMNRNTRLITSRTTSALVSLARFPFHPVTQSTKSCSVQEITCEGSDAGNNSSIKDSKTENAEPIRGLVGLQNLGNTWYDAFHSLLTLFASNSFMNSCLQCVSNVPAILTYFRQDGFTPKINVASATQGALASAFGDLIKALWTGDQFTATKPDELKRVIGRVASRFLGYDQQDAQEFLRFLLDGLHEELNEVTTKPAYYEIQDRPEANDRDVSDEYWRFYYERNVSALSTLFSGQLRSEICCETCNYRSLCFDIFWDLSLPVPKKSTKPSPLRVSSGFFAGLRTVTDAATSVKNVSIYDCLKVYTEKEVLCDDAAFYCSKCKTPRSVMKKISIYRLPKILVLHLKRFSFSTLSREKVSHSITFPSQSLDIAEYCAADAVVDGSTLYDLTGIVHHVGSLPGGHYTAECLNADTQEWYSFNDASVTAIKQPELHSSSAYMLFYQRRQEESRTI
ncbi:hypothetical protein CCR75_004785 [Bremia lactucae]|uniref:ubiquitinyl hydrolase 1 n=1 Tax=Bremia lactucae TaxID=4779 RepID=A0A976FGP8_BRELC|nr:hypothetical protein CCR75_004785 [Bremia lactucae]